MKGDEPSRLQEEMAGKESDQSEKVVETVPPTARNDTQALVSREENNDHNSQLEETEKHVEDGISQTDGTAQKKEENVENGHGRSQGEIDGDDTVRYQKRYSVMVNSPLKQEREHISVYKIVKAVGFVARTETHVEYVSQLEERKRNGGHGMSQGNETLQKKKEIVKITSGNPQGETWGKRIDRYQKTDLNLVNSPSKRERENDGVYKILKGIEDSLQIGPKHIHGDIHHGLLHQKQVERSEWFKGILESVGEGTHGVASGLAESKNDMQKETGISHHRHTLGERDADGNFLPSSPKGPSGVTLNQKGWSESENFCCIHFKGFIRSKLCRGEKSVFICMRSTKFGSYDCGWLLINHVDRSGETRRASAHCCGG